MAENILIVSRRMKRAQQVYCVLLNMDMCKTRQIKIGIRKSRCER